jgi:XisH protein
VPAKNLYHDVVVRALKADGWTITDDPRRTHETLLTEEFGRFIIAQLQIRLLVFDEKEEKVVRWIS